MLGRGVESLMEERKIDDLGIEEHLTNEGLAPAVAEGECDTKEHRKESFFGCEPSGVEIEQAKAASNDNGDKA